MVTACFLTEYLNMSWVHGAAWYHDTLVLGPHPVPSVSLCARISTRDACAVIPVCTQRMRNQQPSCHLDFLTNVDTANSFTTMCVFS